MSQNELTGYRPPLDWRRLGQLVWSLESAFRRAKGADKAEDDTRLRIFMLLALFAAGFVCLAVGATRCALFSDAGKTSNYLPPLGVARADLTDRNGRLLAVDLTHYGLYVDPREIWDSSETQRVLSAALPALQAARLEKALRSDRREYLLGGLTPDEKARIQDMGLPGVSFEEEARRVYPLDSTGAHVIGFTDKGGAGLAGMELAFDDQIRRQAGHDAFATSLDLRVQAALDDELRKAAEKFGVNDAVGIVTNIHTGEVLGMSSWPRYDPNAPGQSPPYNMINRAAASVYEPGSVFKVFSMAMALDSGSATLNSTYNVESLQIGKRTIHDFHAVHGAITLPEVFIHSSNIGTAKMALQAGAPTLTRYFKAFGLFAPAKIELTESARPILPKTWGEGTVASTSFGQSISVSPLNLAQGMGAILNGGELVPLTLRKLDARPKGVRVVSEDTSRKMLDLMRLNVTAKEGSGGKADAPGLSVGGKTGTAQLVVDKKYSKDRVLASFAAVFPTDGPIDADRYFVLIMLKDPKRLPETYGFATAGWNAAPAAGRVIDRIAPFVGVKRASAAQAAATTVAATAKPSGDEGSTTIDGDD
jgi:cell division protein FtsI (penicillin-binding protein 3)